MFGIKINKKRKGKKNQEKTFIIHGAKIKATTYKHAKEVYDKMEDAYIGKVTIEEYEKAKGLYFPYL